MSDQCEITQALKDTIEHARSCTACAAIFRSTGASFNGQRGGKINRDKMLAREPDYYKRIGVLGGAANREKMLAADPDHYKKLGARGGAAVKAAHGPDYFREIGKKGGAAVSSKRGPDHYKQMGRAGGIARAKGWNTPPKDSDES